MSPCFPELSFIKPPVCQFSVRQWVKNCNTGETWVSGGSEVFFRFFPKPCFDIVCRHMIGWLLVRSDRQIYAPSPPPVAVPLSFVPQDMSLQAGSSTLIPPRRPYGPVWGPSPPTRGEGKDDCLQTFYGRYRLDGSYWMSFAHVKESM